MRSLAAVILGVILISGCGGGGGAAAPSPFAGTWAGTLAMADGSGPDPNPADVQMTVDSKGRITGTWVDPTASGSLAGAVSAGGGATLHVAFAGPPPVTLTGQGNSSLTGAGWQGSLPVTDTGYAGTVLTLAATRQ